MPETSTPDDEHPPPDADEKVLVCGVCEEILSGSFEHGGDADAAADEHAEGKHPEHAPVVVVPAPAPLAETQPDQLVDIASQAQAKLEQDLEVGVDPIVGEMDAGERDP